MLPFRIYKVQSDGDLHFIEALPTLDEAKTRVRELGEYGRESTSSTMKRQESDSSLAQGTRRKTNSKGRELTAP